jgi:hypothetical protein
MSSAPLSDADFWNLHAANRRTPRYRQMRREMIEADDRCAVCGHDYRKKGHSKWALNMDHKRYRDSKGLMFGREQKSDFRLRCPDCHTRGADTDDSIRRWRNSRLFCKGLVWLVLLPLRYAWKALWSAPRM